MSGYLGYLRFFDHKTQKKCGCEDRRLVGLISSTLGAEVVPVLHPDAMQLLIGMPTATLRGCILV